MNKMTKEEMLKYSAELVVKNNPDEAVKLLLQLQKENKLLKDIKAKAIKYIKRALKDDHSEFMYMSEPDIILDILKGADNE